MNKPIILAQSSAAQMPKKTVRVLAPSNKTPEIVNVVPNLAIDLQAIERNQISLVKSGDNLVILFDDQRSIILSNFYGSTGAPLTGLDLILSPTTTIPAVDLSRILPVGASDTIVPASGTSSPSGSLILSDLFHLTTPSSSSTQTTPSSSSQSTSTSQTPAAGLTNFVTPFSTGRDALLPSFTNQIQINKAPVVNGLLGLGVQEDQPNLARFDLLGGASDADGDTLSISGLTYSVDGRGTGSTLPTGLSLSGSRLTVNAASPAFNDLGVGEIRLIRIAYTISDGHGGSVAQTAVITVEGTNDTPIVGTPITLPEASFEDIILTISSADVLANVSDPDGDALTITAVNARSASGAAVSLVNGNIVYDPTNAATVQALQPGQSLIDTLTYTISDGHGGTAQTTVSLNVTGVNHAPIVSRTFVLTGSSDENSTRTISAATLLSHVSDQDGDTLTITSVNATSSSGAAVSLVDGNIVYDPTNAPMVQAGRIGQILYDTLTFTVSDGHGGSAVGTFTISILGENDAPVVVSNFALSGSSDENSIRTINPVDLLANASDPDAGDRVQVVSVERVSSQAAAVSMVSGNIVYDPRTSYAAQALGEGESLTDFITYRVADNSGSERLVTVSVNVTGVNDAPIVTAAPAYTLLENTGLFTIDLLAGASDIDGNWLSLSDVTYSVDGEPASSTLPDGFSFPTSGSSGQLTVSTSSRVFDDLQVGETRVIRIAYMIGDGHGGSVAQSATVTIDGRNDAPPSISQGLSLSGSSNEDSIRTISDAMLLQFVVDPDGDIVTLTSVNATSHLGAAVSRVDGNVIYDPTNAAAVQALKDGESLTDFLTYTVSDGHGGDGIINAIALTVTGRNDAPVIGPASPLSGSTSEDSIRVISWASLLANVRDPEGDTVTITSVNATSFLGAAVYLGNGTVVYDPTNASAVQALDDGESLTDFLTYTISDGHGGDRLTTISLNVTGQTDNSAPIVSAAPSFTLAENSSPVTFNLLDGATDLDGDTLTVSAVTYAINGEAASSTLPTGLSLAGAQLSVNASSPAFDDLKVGETRVIHLSYLIEDGRGGSAAQNATVVIQGRNDAPVYAFATVPGSSGEDSLRVISGASLLANVRDPDGDTVTITSVNATSSSGAAVSLVNGDIVYDPTNAANVRALNDGESLTDFLVYTVTDVNGASSQVTTSLTVNGVISENHAPVFAPNANPSAYVDEDYSRTVAAANLLASVSDPDGDTVTIASVNAISALGAAVSLVDGDIVYDPTAAATLQALKADPFGYDYAPDVVTYTVSDGHGGYTVGTFTMYVRGMNDAPVVAAPQTLQVAEGSSPVQLDLLAAASDVDGDSLRVYYGNHRPTYTVDGVEVSSIPAGVAQYGLYALIVSPSSVAFDDLGIGETRVIGVNYRIYDGDGASVFQSIQISITGTNDAPVAPALNLLSSSNEDSTRAISVETLLANVTDPEGDAFSITSVNATSALGAAVSMVDGNIVYDPRAVTAFQALQAGEGLTDTLTYSVSDENGGTTLATVTLTVDGANDAPIAVADKATNGGMLGQEFRINTLTSGAPLDPSVAVLADGGFVVTYTYNVLDIFGQRFDAGGQAVGSEFQINTYTSSSQWSSSVAALADGGFVVTWHSQYQDGSGYGIYGQRYDSAGQAAGPEFRVNTVTSGHQLYPEVTALTGGGFVVTWEDGNSVVGQGYDAAGQAIGGEFYVGGLSYRGAYLQSTAALDDGGFVLTWTSFGKDPDGSEGVYGQRYDAEGTALGSQFRINTFLPNSQNTPSVASLADGGFVVTWQSLLQDGLSYGVAYGIYGQRYDAEGLAVGAEFQVNTTTDNTQKDSKVTGLADGGFVVTWSSTEQDGSETGVYGQRYDASGRAIGSEFLINSFVTGSQDNPTIAALGDHGFVVIWQSSVQTGGHTGIYGQRFYFGSNDEDTIFQFEASPLLANDKDIDGDTLTISAISETSNLGAAVSLVDGHFAYDPTHAAQIQALGAGETINDTFTYTISDGHGGTSTGTVLLAVNGVNDAPSVSAEPAFTLIENGSPVTFNLLSDASDLDGDTLTVSGVTYAIDGGAASRTLPSGLSLSGEQLTVNTSSPAFDDLQVGETRVIRVAYTISDGHGGSVAQSATMTIEGRNDFPFVPTIELPSGGIYQNTKFPLFAADLLANASDPDGDTITIISVRATTPLGATVSLVDGNIVYDPTHAAPAQELDSTESLADIVTYTISDGHGGTYTGTVSLTVRGLNDAPTTSAVLSYVLDEDDRLGTFDLLAGATDIDNDPLTVSGVTYAIDNGAASSFIPTGVSLSGSQLTVSTSDDLAVGETRVIRVAYTISDVWGASVAQNATVTIEGRNDAPVFVPTFALSGSSDENHIRTISAATLLANVSDPDGDTVTITSVNATSSRGAAVSLVNGNIVYDPTNAANVQVLNDGESLTDVLMYTISDGHGGDRLVTVSLNVTGVSENHVPVVVPFFVLSGSSDENSIRTLDAATLLANVSDPDGDTVTITSVNATSSRGAAVSLVNGDIVYDPTHAANVQALNDGESLTDVLMYTISDGHGASSLITVGLNVTGVSENHVPVVVPFFVLSGSSDENSIRTLDAATLLANVSDPDGDTVTITSVNATSSRGAAVSLVNGDIVYDPTHAANVQALNDGESLTDVLMYTISDGHGASSLITVGLNVTGVSENHVPVVVPFFVLSGSSDENSIRTLDAATLLANVSDPDGDTVTITSVNATSSRGAAVSLVNGDIVYDPTHAANVQALNGGESLTDVLMYTISDGHGASSLITVGLNVTGVSENHVPVVVPFFVLSGSSDENSIRTLDAATLLANVSDPDGDTVTITSVNATSSRGAAVSLVNGDIVYDPTHAANVQALNDGESLTDVLMYTISDGHGASSLITVGLNVTGVSENHAPLAVDDPDAGTVTGTPALLEPTFILNASPLGTNDAPSVAVLSNGHYATVYVNYDSQATMGQEHRIYGRVMEPGGVPVSSEFVVNSNTSGDEFAPKITALNDGGFAVVWIDTYDADPVDSNQSIHIRLFDADGTARGDDVRLFNNVGQEESRLSIDTLADGRLVVSWSVSPDDWSGHNVLAAVLNPDGSIDHGPFQVNQNDVYEQTYSQVTALANGEFVVTWYDNTGEPYDEFGFYGAGVTARLYAADGSALGSEFLVNSTTFREQYLPDVTQLADGRLLFVWRDESGDYLQFGSPIRGRFFNADGSAAGEDVALVTRMTASSNIVEGGNVLALPNGQFVLTWLETQNYVDHTARAQVFDAAGAPVGDELVLGDSSGAADLSLDLLANGDVVVTWSGLIWNGTDFISAIKSRTIDIDSVVGLHVNQENSLTLDPAVLLANDIDTDGDILTLIAVSGQSAHGASVSLINGQIVYDPTASSALQALATGETLTDTFTYNISDGISGTSTATVSLTVHGTNSAPVANDDIAFGPSAVGNVLFNDTDLDAPTPNDSMGGHAPDGLSIVNAGTYHGAYGDLILNADGSFSYTRDDTSAAIRSLATTDVAADTFAYTVSDPRGATDSAEITVYIHGLNDVPVASDDGAGSVQPVEVTEEFRINTTTAGYQMWQATAALADGGFVVAWAALGADGYYNDVFAQRYAANGSAVGGEFLVNSNTLSHQSMPSLTGLPDGGFLIVWDSNGPDGNGNEIYAQRYGADGSLTGPEFRVNTSIAGEQSTSAVATLADGGFVVSWMSSSPDTDSTDVFAQVFASDGTKVGTEFRVNSYTTSFQSVPSVTGLDGGGFVIAWMSENQDGSYRGVYGQHYNADGSSAGGEFLISTTTLGFQEMPTITSLSGGGFVATWSSNDGSGWGGHVYSQLYAADGARIGSEFVLNTANFPQDYPFVSRLEDGGFVVAWRSWGQDGNNSGIFGQRFSDSGQKLGDEFQINSYTQGDQHYPTVTGLADGSFVVTWMSEGQDGSSYGIYGKVYQTPLYLVASEDSALVLAASSLLANDSDANGDALSVTAVSATSAHGAAVSLVGGQIIYDPTHAANVQALGIGETLTDSFTYTVQDTYGAQSIATVTVTVAGANDAPVVVPVILGGTKPEDALRTITATELLAHLVDPDGDSLSLSAVSATSASGAAVTLNGTNLVYDPTTAAAIQAMHNGDQLTDYVFYSVSDGHGGSSTGTVSLVVTGRSDTPTVSGTLALSVDEDAAPQSLDLLSGASDAEGDALAISSLIYSVDGGTASSTQPTGLSLSGATLTIDPTSSAFDDLVSGDSRTIQVSYRVTDGSSSGAAQTAVLTVNGTNAAPMVSGPVTLTTTEYNGAAGTSPYASINLLSGAGDTDGDSLSVTGFSFAVDGVASSTVPAGLMIAGTTAYIDSSDPTFNALHNGETRTITVSYTISDGNGGSMAQSAELTINGATDAPRPLADSLPADQMMEIGNVLFLDTSSVALHSPREINLSSGGSVILSTTYALGANGADISGQIYNASGVAVGDAFRVNTYTSGAQNALSAATLSDGGFVVAWESFGQDGSGYGVYGQRYNNAGIALGGEFKINTTTSNYQYHPYTTALTGGGFVVSWISLGQDGNESGLYGQRYDASGTALGSEFKVNTTAAGFQMNAGTTATPDGGFYASWLTADQDDGTVGVYSQLYNATGAAIGGEVHIRNYTRLSDPVFSNMLSTPDGGYIVTWTSFNEAANSYELYGQRYNAVDRALAETYLITSSASFSQPDFSLFYYNSFDSFFAVAQDTYGKDGSYYGRFGQPYAFATTDEDTALTISTSSLLANDTDSEGDVLSIIAVSATSSNGAAVSLVNGNIIYDPTRAATIQEMYEGQRLTDSFSYSVSDGHGGTTTATVSLVVVGQEDESPQTINGTAGHERLQIAIDASTLNGRDGDDFLIARGDFDTLDGGADNDTLLAVGTNTILLGGSGDDNLQVLSSIGSRMEGGSGSDTLASGTGSDTIVFGQDGGNDILFNFTSGTDAIEIAAALAGASSTGTLAANGALGGTILFEAVNGNVAASNTSATLIYDTANGNLYIDADGGNSTSGRSLLVHLESGASLTATDIHIA